MYIESGTNNEFKMNVEQILRKHLEYAKKVTKTSQVQQYTRMSSHGYIKYCTIQHFDHSKPNQRGIWTPWTKLRHCELRFNSIEQL